jgi:hypothetical protein
MENINTYGDGKINSSLRPKVQLADTQWAGCQKGPKSLGKDACGLLINTAAC